MKTLETPGIGVARVFTKRGSVARSLDAYPRMEQIRVLVTGIRVRVFVVLAYGCKPGLYFFTVAFSMSAGVNATRFISPFANIAA